MTTTQLRHLLLHSDWMSNFDERTLERAHVYARQGKVLELELLDGEAGTWLLQGLVSGSGHRVYTCRIAIEAHDQWLTVDTDCSCPVGIECKHAAAMLLTAQDESPRADRHAAAQAPATDPADGPAWLAALQATRPEARPHEDLPAWELWFLSLQSTPQGSEHAAPERRFGILLRAGTDGAGPASQLLACPAWLRPAKTKARTPGLVDPQSLRLDLQHGPLPAPAEGWPDGIAPALATLLACRTIRIGNLSWRAIRAWHEEQALDRLLRHYPVWFERGQNRLERAADVPLQLHWRETDDGRQQLAAKMPDDGVILRAAGLWYVQPQSLRYGRMKGAPHLLDRLHHAPLLAPELVGAWRERQQALAPDSHLPAPIERDPPQPLIAEPVPVLRMRELTARHWAGRTHRIAVARCLLDYDGIRLEAHRSTPHVQRRLHQGRLFDVQRNASIETQALRSLEQCGGIPAQRLHDLYFDPDSLSSNDFVLRPNARGLPRSPEDCQAILRTLGDAGFTIEYEDGFPHDEVVYIDAWHADIESSGNAWFDVSLGIDVGNQRVDLLPFLRRLLADPSFPRTARKG